MRLTPEYEELARKKLDEYAENEPISTWEREVILEFLPIWCEVIVPGAFEAGDKYRCDQMEKYGQGEVIETIPNLNQFLQTIIQTDD